MNVRTILFMATILMANFFSGFAQQADDISLMTTAGDNTNDDFAITVNTQTDGNKEVQQNLEIRSNMLYDFMLTPTLGLEWRINRTWGIKVDGSFTHWGSKHGMVHNIWLVNPEIRWYISNIENFYLGLGGNMGRYNIYNGVTGKLFFPNETGYQGKIYNGGICTGYKLTLSSALSLDFNLGLGYTYVKYDSFTVTDRVRWYKMIKEKDVTKNQWGFTQAGISLVWQLSDN